MKRPRLLPNPSPELSARILKAFEEGTPIDRVVKAAVREALAKNSQSSPRPRRSRRKTA